MGDISGFCGLSYHRCSISDEVPSKPTPYQEQAVKDSKGRYQRFHGAFTGGFSAGFFNTVGTKEGVHLETFVICAQVSFLL